MCREIENSGITTENEHKSNKVSLLTFGDFSHRGSVEKCSVAGQLSSRYYSSEKTSISVVLDGKSLATCSHTFFILPFLSGGGERMRICPREG